MNDFNAYEAPRKEGLPKGNVSNGHPLLIGATILSCCILLASIATGIGFFGGSLSARNAYAADRAQQIRLFLHSDPSTFAHVSVDDSTGGYVYINGHVETEGAAKRIKSEVVRLYGAEGLKDIRINLK